MRQVAAFDFDGTITRRDTLPEFIKFAKGGAAFRAGLLRLAPGLAAYGLGLRPAWKAKQRLFAHFFGGTPLDEFDAMCEDFFRRRHRDLLRPEAVERMREHAAEGAELIIVSASAENRVAPFGRFLGVSRVIATRLETGPDGRLTGRFLTANCRGREKARRLREALPDRDGCLLTAYGDSRGDREMLEFADIGHYKHFK